jgi:hypothetical protein
MNMKRTFEIIIGAHIVLRDLATKLFKKFYAADNIRFFWLKSKILTEMEKQSINFLFMAIVVVLEQFTSNDANSRKLM